VPENFELASKYSICPSVATQDFGWNDTEAPNSQFTLISAGRLVPLKGFDLTIKAFAKFFHQLDSKGQDKCQLLLVGSGPEEEFLKELANKLRVHEHVEFMNWIAREQLMEKFKTASVFLFPSHEGAGMVVAEALSFGLPVICLDNEGPGQFINSDCGFAVAHQGYEDTINGLSDALLTLFEQPEKRKEMSHAARQKFETTFHWDRRGEQLQKIYAAL